MHNERFLSLSQHFLLPSPSDPSNHPVQTSPSPSPFTMSTARDPETQESSKMRYTTIGKLIHDIDPSLIQPTRTQAETGELDARFRYIEIMKAEGHIRWSNLENAVNDCARSIERGIAPFEYVDAIIDHVVGCVERGTTHVDIGISAIAKIASALLKQSEYGINRNDSIWIKDTGTLHRNAAWAFERIYTISVTDGQLLTLSKRVVKRLVRLCQRYDAYESMTWFMHDEYGMWFV